MTKRKQNCQTPPQWPRCHIPQPNTERWNGFRGGNNVEVSGDDFLGALTNYNFACHPPTQIKLKNPQNKQARRLRRRGVQGRRPWSPQTIEKIQESLTSCNFWVVWFSSSQEQTKPRVPFVKARRNQGQGISVQTTRIPKKPIPQE